MSRVNVIWATPHDAEAMAQAHAGAFTPGWREDEFEDLLDGEGVFGFLARGQDGPLGVILCRIAAEEMEVLTIGVPETSRRQGVAKALMAAALAAAHTAGARACFLEVAVDNAAAAALYAGLGFRRAGLRKAYYDRGAAGVMDAAVMRLDLNAGPA
jgi:ribosomal-protein-alanine N-acetyltransferase